MKKSKLSSLLSKLEEASPPANEDVVVNLNDEMAKRIVTHYTGGSNGTCSNNTRCSGNESCSNNGVCSGNNKCNQQ